MKIFWVSSVRNFSQVPSENQIWLIIRKFIVQNAENENKMIKSAVILAFNRVNLPWNNKLAICG